MRVCHFSDWHAKFQKLPEADLYVCTGDMFDTYPIKVSDNGLRYWTIDRDNEIRRQTEWLTTHFEPSGGFQEILGSPDAPIICVMGNHDFIDLAHLFKGCNLVHEFIDNEVITVLGRRVTGHRGIPYISGHWNNEVRRPDLMDRVLAMPSADLYLTHYPPQGILDSSIPPGYSGEGESYGLGGMGDNIVHRGDRAVHLFGHIHEHGGIVKKIGGVRFSNAATTVNMLDL